MFHGLIIVFVSQNLMMNNNKFTHNFPQTGFNYQNSSSSENQHPSRSINPRFNYQPSFNHNAQRPAFTGAPNILNNNNLQPPIQYPASHSSFNTAPPPPKQSQNVPFSQHNYLQPHSTMYDRSSAKQSPTITHNFSSLPNNDTSCFPLNFSNPPSQIPNFTHNTSFQSKESSSNSSQYRMTSLPPPIDLNITRPPNVHPPIPPHQVNYQGTIMSSSYNPSFVLPPHPPVMPHNPNISSQISNKSLTPVNHSQPATFTNSFPLMPQHMPAPFPQIETHIPPPVVKPVSEKECKISSFLEKLTPSAKKKPLNNVTVAQFRSTLKEGLSLVKKLKICKNNLLQLLQSDEKDWALEVNKVTQYQNQLTQACTFLTMPKYLNSIQKRLELIKKKRMSMKKLRQNLTIERNKKMEEREQLNQEIDKWLDSIKEKNLKLKRETEMKKEADSILSEVRRKIQEAKRTVEKIKVFEKLRNTRQLNVAKKGLFLPDHDERFQKSISDLKETVYRQLSHYESEEKALKVMLEAEQEGQLEEEAKWKIKRLRTLHEKRQKNIIESLFGDSTEEPEEDEPIYLFYQFQNSGNKSIENLVQIRHQWDMHISENGESIPHQWVVPVPPTSSAWEVALNS